MKKKKTKETRYQKTSTPGIYQLGKDKYEIRVSVGKDECGRYKPIREIFFGTLSAAKDRRAALIVKKNNYGPTPPSSDTVEQFLNKWLRDYVSSKALKTQKWYKMHVDNNIVPYIGNVRLKDLTPSVVSNLYATLLSLSKSETIRSGVHRTLRKAINWGVGIRDIVGANPMSGIHEPRIRRQPVGFLSRQEVTALLSVSKALAPEITNLLTVMLLTGIRKGEALGLRWADVDFERSTIHIRQQLITDGRNPIFSPPKTDTSVRVISLSQNALNALLAEKANQDVIRKNNPDYCDYDLVFCQQNGRPLPHKSTYNKLHSCFRVALSGKDYGFHVLRHTAISHMLLKKVPLKGVSEMSGHKLTSTTLNIYSHVLRDTMKEAVKELEDVFFHDGAN